MEENAQTLPRKSGEFENRLEKRTLSCDLKKQQLKFNLIEIYSFESIFCIFSLWNLSHSSLLLMNFYMIKDISVRVLTGEGVYAFNVSYQRIITGNFLLPRWHLWNPKKSCNLIIYFLVMKIIYRAFISFLHFLLILKCIHKNFKTIFIHLVTQQTWSSSRWFFPFFCTPFI